MNTKLTRTLLISLSIGCVALAHQVKAMEDNKQDNPSQQKKVLMTKEVLVELETALCQDSFEENQKAMETLDWVASTNKALLNSKPYSLLEMAIYRAKEQCHDKNVALLLKKGANPNTKIVTPLDNPFEKDTILMTALEVAVDCYRDVKKFEKSAQNCLNVITLLLDAGADVAAFISPSSNNLSWVVKEGENKTILQYVIESKDEKLKAVFKKFMGG